MPPHYIHLALAILCETLGTSMIKLSDGFTKPLPTVGIAIFFMTAFYLLSLTMRVMPMGVIYAVWSGLGIVLITAIGFVVFKQKLDTPAFLGMGLIVAGVIVIHLFSNAKA